MNQVLLIATGGALGAVARHGLASLINSQIDSRFPLGTLAVNVIGSLVIGIMYVVIIERLNLHPDWRNIISIGFLGAFTTFSTFSLEIVQLLEQGQILTAGLYLMCSILSCIILCWLGIIITRSLI